MVNEGTLTSLLPSALVVLRLFLLCPSSVSSLPIVLCPSSSNKSSNNSEIWFFHLVFEYLAEQHVKKKKATQGTQSAQQIGSVDFNKTEKSNGEEKKDVRREGKQLSSTFILFVRSHSLFVILGVLVFVCLFSRFFFLAATRQVIPTATT